MQITATEVKFMKFTDTVEGLPQARSYFQKTVFRKRKVISNNMNGFLLNSGQICKHARRQTANCVTLVTKCIARNELY